MDGKLIKANKRLASRTGITNPMIARRHPPRLAIEAIMGAPMTNDKAPPAIIHPIALALFSKEKYSPISVTHIGETIAHPSPLRE